MGHRIMKKILYLMNVDWNWIKQRPHFLAEQLEQYYNLTVVNQHRYIKKGYQNRKFNGKFISFKVIPRIDRYFGLRWINIILKKKIIKKLIISERPDYIWVTDPDHINWLPKKYIENQLIYDCMDDHYGLSTSKRKNIIFTSEKKLCRRSYKLFVSSNYLADVLMKRYGESLSSKITVVRNGYDGKLLKLKDVSIINNKKFIIAYFGTFAEWFDFDLIKKSLNEIEELEYRFIGPTAHGVVIPEDRRIKYIGTVEHKDLYKSVEDVDCLLMPFKINESIKAVDPVKLYEYINFGKNIISIEYQEIHRFEPFVYFYKDFNEYKEIILKLKQQNKLKYTNEMRVKFLSENSWQVRGLQIMNTLEKRVEN